MATIGIRGILTIARLLPVWFAMMAAGVIAPVNAAVTDSDLARIGHIIVIYAENRSFDHLYGNFPGTNGLANATDESKTQLDHDGTPLPFIITWQGDKPHPRFGMRMPNGPFLITAPPIEGAETEVLPSPIHAFYHNAEQINGGKNNMFVAMSNVGGWAMGYFDTSNLRLWQWAKDFTLADNFFMGAYGGSFLNHQYLICACAPEFEGAPAAITAVLGPDGRMRKREGSPSAKDGPVRIASNTQVTPDGFAVNTTQPPYQPSGIPTVPGGDPRLADPKGTNEQGPPLPPQTARTIGDTLSSKGIDWAWYAGGWRQAEEDGPRAMADRKVIYRRDGPNFQPHHQPFNYYARFAPGTADRTSHLRDGDDLFAAIAEGNLPPVVFYKPGGPLNQHPGYTDLVSGDAHIAGLLERIRANPKLWADTLVIVTYDENGGFWDHVAPPSGPGWSDRWGPGTRIPALIVSQFARKGYVDHARYDTGSIIKLITRRFSLEPLPGVRPNTGDLTGALQFD
jgi:acid phosphatase